MIEELKGKRLLLLGGTAWLNVIKAFAHENNITLIAAGNDPSSPLFEVDEYYCINSTDHEGMKRLITDAKIDGVYVGSNETVIRHALQYVSELNLPCYCSLEQWDALMNKRRFKNLCELFGIPVTPSYSYSPSHPCDIDFPVIVKPADGCGSVGITICKNYNDLEVAYRFAYEKSPTHEVIIEKYVKNTGMDVFFQITDGVANWCVLGDKYPVQFQLGAGSVAGARVLPSRYSEEFQERFEEKLKQLFSYVGLKHGLVWIEVFHDGDDYFFNEVGYRPNGSLSIVSIDYLCGINTVAADIYYDLTGISRSHGFPSLILKKIPVNKKKVCEYWVACNPGVVGEIGGIQTIRNHPNVLAAFPKYGVGSTIPHTNGFAQNFCVIHLAFNSADELRQIIEYINKRIFVLNNRGEDMIIHKGEEFISNLVNNCTKIENCGN